MLLTSYKKNPQASLKDRKHIYDLYSHTIKGFNVSSTVTLNEKCRGRRTKTGVFRTVEEEVYIDT